jgi:hypothetical protein
MRDKLVFIEDGGRVKNIEENNNISLNKLTTSFQYKQNLPLLSR